jgi:hypothetical protein
MCDVGLTHAASVMAKTSEYDGIFRFGGEFARRVTTEYTATPFYHDGIVYVASANALGAKRGRPDFEPGHRIRRAFSLIGLAVVTPSRTRDGVRPNSVKNSFICFMARFAIAK